MKKTINSKHAHFPPKLGLFDISHQNIHGFHGRVVFYHSSEIYLELRTFTSRGVLRTSYFLFLSKTSFSIYFVEFAFSGCFQYPPHFWHVFFRLPRPERVPLSPPPKIHASTKTNHHVFLETSETYPFSWGATFARQPGVSFTSNSCFKRFWFPLFPNLPSIFPSCKGNTSTSHLNIIRLIES